LNSKPNISFFNFKIYIVFHEPETYQVGWNKTTLAEYQAPVGVQHGKGQHEVVHGVHQQQQQNQPIRQ
jgi:hypothetical protein